MINNQPLQIAKRHRMHTPQIHVYRLGTMEHCSTAPPSGYFDTFREMELDAKLHRMAYRCVTSTLARSLEVY